MKGTKGYILILMVATSLAFLFYSCQEEIDLDLNNQETERIIVEGRVINRYESHVIRLTRSISYFQNELIPPLIDAEVYLIENESGKRYDMNLAIDSLGIYLSEQFRGLVGHTYALHINFDGESWEALSYLDTVPDIDSINYEYEYINYFKQGFYKILMSAYEPPPVGDIYMFNIYKNDTLYNDQLLETPYQEDLLFNDMYLSDLELMWIPQEEVTLDTNVIRIEMLSISREEYNYNNAFIAESYANGSIFSGPPANIPSNLLNTSGGLDGLGFFGASSITSLEMLLLKQHNDSTNNTDYQSFY
jgi:hypothetical protein